MSAQPAEVRADRAERVAVWLALAALVAWSAWQRWRVLAESPFPLGVDGYFYPVQLRALLSTGHLHYPAAPLAFYLLAPFAAATDPITGAKLGAAILGALVAVPAYGVGCRLGRNRGAGLLAAVLATTSAGSTYMTIEFVKNGIGITVALAAIWIGLAAIARPTRARIVAAVVAVVAAALTHKMAVALALLVLAPAAIAEALGRDALRGRRRLYALGGALALIVLAVIAGVVAPQRFASPADVAQLAHVWGRAHWELPALVGAQQELAMGDETRIGAMLAAVVASALLLTPFARADRGERAATIAIVVLALAIALPVLDVEDPQGLGFRLRVAAYVPMALLAAIAARPVLAAFPDFVRRCGSPALIALAAIVALAMPRAADRAEGQVVTHPALASATMALVGQLPRGAELVVPERHIAFMVAWYTGAPVALRPDDTDRAHRYRLLPLAFIGAGSPLDRALDDARREPALEPPLGVHARHPNGLVLVAEPTWEWALTRLPERLRRRFAQWTTI